MLPRTLELHRSRRQHLPRALYIMSVLAHCRTPLLVIKINNCGSGLSFSAKGKQLFVITNKGTFIRRKYININALKQNDKGQVRELK